VTERDPSQLKSAERDVLRREIERQLIDRHGPMMTGDALRAVLGYASKEAFRQALSRGRVSVPIFEIEHRRGKSALTSEVAAWVVECRAAAKNETSRRVAEGGGT
jgi:hypothetical protein